MDRIAKSKSGRRISRRKLLTIGSLSGVVGLGAWQWNEVDNLTIEHRTLRLPRWKADGFRIAVLSDLHANTRHEGERAATALRLALAEKPDAVLLVGDYIHKEYPETLDSLERALSPARGARVPILAAMGNHDYWVSTSKEVVDALKRNSIRLLRNEVTEVDGVAVMGIDDGLENYDRHDFLSAKQDSGSVLALFHEPDYVSRVDNRVGLMLSGHSHGGQICLPFGIPMHTPIGAIRYKRGYYPDANVPLYVTRGIGTIGPRKRAFCSPEIALLTLHGANTA